VNPVPPKIVLFDLFHTLVYPDTTRMAVVEAGPNHFVPSTAPQLLPLVRRWHPEVSEAALLSALAAGWQQAEALRHGRYREWPARERFAAVLASLNIDATPARADALLAAHRHVLHAALQLPPEVEWTLREVGKTCRLGLITNYDDADGAWRLLAQRNLAAHFEAIVVSAQEGYVKPHPSLFERALQQFGAKAAEAVYVGDNWDTDVLGARRAGVQPIWLRRSGDNSGDPQVVPTLTRLEQLPALLERWRAEQS